ncbi:type-F conjugative transfer system pilin assembly protein TrbC [Paenalcaligenes sp.]|uniref:type-F conjugative transfer system pilin assembly protein TrbC n=1 Tax=Paenalcaligenes sp. TaxID=1966342 RepID=UPI002627929E|nr:type-F conjugative transfer system pilin assembly protein TrbC [Paenalcaligenes sp.]
MKKLLFIAMFIGAVSQSYAQPPALIEGLREQQIRDIDKAMQAIGGMGLDGKAVDEQAQQKMNNLVVESLRQVDQEQKKGALEYKFRPNQEGNQQAYESQLKANKAQAMKNENMRQLIDKLGQQHTQRAMESLPASSELGQGALLIFVSFSMPERTLKNLSRQAYQYGATVVLRGFVDDSLEKTKNLAKKVNEHGAAWQIHPELFETFNVKNVPTFVMTSDVSGLDSGCGGGNECATNLGYTSISGDISLMAALDYFRRDSAFQFVRELAQKMLDAE